jgi:hypothetical protein
MQKLMTPFLALNIASSRKMVGAHICTTLTRIGLWVKLNVRKSITRLLIQPTQEVTTRDASATAMVMGSWIVVLLGGSE